MFGEGEWKVKKHGSEKRRTWRKLHLAVDVDTHEINWNVKNQTRILYCVMEHQVYS